MTNKRFQIVSYSVGALALLTMAIFPSLGWYPFVAQISVMAGVVIGDLCGSR